MFLPVTKAESKRLGWDRLDVILVTGDSYIDSPYMGIALIGKVLAAAGYRVGIIAQPDLKSDSDITRLGEPELFWGVSAGCVDSMVANYTATKKRRRQDDYTPGGVNNRRPDRACIAYTNLIRQYFKNTVPIVLGGLEASLRRVAHYDYWDDRVRRSILFDAKADALVYGMGERAVEKIANKLKNKCNIYSIEGICYIGHDVPDGYIVMPAYEDTARNKRAFIRMFNVLSANNDPATAHGLAQKHGDRYLVQNPPARYLAQAELDRVHDLRFERDQHPWHARMGGVRALDTIRFSLPTHRGCYGECNFCAIAVHQGRTVQWRSQDSVLKEAAELTRHQAFKGIIQDVGGPTANMYGFECQRKIENGACVNKRCISVNLCVKLKPSHDRQIALLQALRTVPGVRKVFVASGIRYDLLRADRRSGMRYLKEIVNHHVSGQLKIAPEHCVERVLSLMGKPGIEALLWFRDHFNRLCRSAGKQQFLTYYLIAAHPGCGEEDMRVLRRFAGRELKVHPEQVQIFTPTPSTRSSLMYATEIDPATGAPLFVEKNNIRKEKQKQIVTNK